MDSGVLNLAHYRLELDTHPIYPIPIPPPSSPFTCPRRFPLACFIQVFLLDRRRICVVLDSPTLRYRYLAAFVDDVHQQL